jgi:hypothetical protein
MMTDIIEEIAIAMRQKWHEIDETSNGQLIPWKDSDKRDVWLQLAKVAVGIAKKDEATERLREAKRRQ